jgi:hypothetical protein
MLHRQLSEALERWEENVIEAIEIRVKIRRCMKKIMQR